MFDAEFSLVVAAAGSGLRLDTTVPKAYFQIEHQTTLLEYQISKFSELPCEVIVVVSPNHLSYLQTLPKWLFERCNFIFQEHLNGTASAIFSAIKHTDLEIVVSCWVDQVGASLDHLISTQILLHQKNVDFVIPLIKKVNPYVVAEMSSAGTISGWKFDDIMTQEMKFTDTGVFGFKRTRMLEVLEKNAAALMGKSELNFLEILLQVTDSPRTVIREVFDSNLTLAINTQEDFNNFKKEQ